MKSPRTSRPGTGNKYFITKVKGGYSSCIQGKPTDSQCNVLSNCVGFACGAYNEEHEFGYEKYHLNCNAENFIERAVASGLSVYQKPMVGGIMVWQKGSLKSSDGAGHVAIVTYVNNAYDPTQIKTSESGYGCKNPFWISTRNKGTGNWGQASTYKYRGCIAPVGYKPPQSPITPNVARDKTKDQIEVLVDQLYVRTDGKKSATALGFAHKGYYNYSSTKESDGYKWYKIAEGQWVASNKGWTNILPKEQPTTKYIQLTANVWCRLKGYGFKYAKYKVIPKNTKCELITKNIGSANGYKWDKVKWNGTVVYLPNNWNKYL